MATNQNQAVAPATTANQASTLAQEIEKIQQDLLEKQKRLQAIQQSEIDKLVNKFVSDIEKAGFDRVVVKKWLLINLLVKTKREVEFIGFAFAVAFPIISFSWS